MSQCAEDLLDGQQVGRADGVNCRTVEMFEAFGMAEKMIDEALAANPKQVEQYRAGKTTMKGFFVGQVMKMSKGTANPAGAGIKSAIAVGIPARVVGSR